MCGKEPLFNYYYAAAIITREYFIVITIKLYEQPKLYEIIIYIIYHDVTIFSQPIVHSYRVNVIIFDLPIHNTSFDANIDSFIINSPLNIN